MLMFTDRSLDLESGSYKTRSYVRTSEAGNEMCSLIVRGVHPSMDKCQYCQTQMLH